MDRPLVPSLPPAEEFAGNDRQPPADPAPGPPDAPAPAARRADLDRHETTPATSRTRSPLPSTEPAGKPAKRRRGSLERRYAGFGDGVDRRFCAAAEASGLHRPPADFPVRGRTGLATLRTVVVARDEGAFLLCDAPHPGPHRWPTGEVVDDDLEPPPNG